ncbi:MAG TPA: FAD:protein FMN transferase [Bryobacteraceae bacterium]|nr:FAD:protein FMN transferase [Bryobacteraceae bacterium]
MRLRAPIFAAWFLWATAGLPGGGASPLTERQSSQVLRFEESLDSMGTTYTIVAYGTDRYRLQSAVESAFEEVKRLEELLSNYRPESEWSRLNRAASAGPVRVSEELFELLSSCMNYSRMSEGAFDITVGPLMKVWGFYKGSGRFPHRAEIKGAMARVGYQLIELDDANKTVRFRRPGVELDPGGIGKGYAVDRAVAILRRGGVQSGLITAGSSSIYGIGSPPHEPRGWHVALRHPKDARKSVADVWLRDESMSTSGNYEKFFLANGRLYSHIMDPRTGYPAQGMLSVSVIAPRTIDSEAWTKPYYINGRRWAASRKTNSTRVFLCEDRTEPLCAWLQ